VSDENFPPSALEKLKQTNPELEIWWDSSPLIYHHWKQEVVKEESNLQYRAILQEYLKRFYDEKNLSATFFDGVTTNPPLTKQVLELNQERWNLWIDELIRKYPCLTIRELSWRLYSEVVRRGAEKYYPRFQVSGYRRGYLSGQVDPRLLQNTREMIYQAISLNNLSPNIMVKMPGTREGIFGITLLTTLGIPTNATLVFTLPQILAGAEAVKKGLEIARDKGIDLSRWRSVVTMMLGRFEDAEEFQHQAKKLNIELTEELKRWAGIAIFKKAYSIFQERGYESKLLAASMRLGPSQNGKTRIWHLEMLAGGKIVLTIFPNIIASFLKNYQEERIVPRIEEEVPQETLSLLLKIPYFKNAYQENGLLPEEFISYPATVETAHSFAAATEDLEAYVEKRYYKISGQIKSNN